MSKEIKKENKVRKVFLDDLPRKEGHGANEGKQVIDWKNSNGYKVKFIYSNIEGEIDIIGVDKFKNNYLNVKYKEVVYSISTKKFKECAIGSILNIVTIKFNIEIGCVFEDNRRNFVIIDRKYVYKKNHNQYQKYYKYHCNKCGNEDWASEQCLIRSYRCSIGCNVCGSSPKKVTEYNCLATKRPDLVKYLVDKNDGYKYTACCNKKILMKCPDCGLEIQYNINRIYYRGFSCSRCSDKRRYPEKFMSFLLNELQIDFLKEYSPKYLIKKEGTKSSRKFSDFYIQSLNLVIETDGGLGHKGGKSHSKSDKTLEECIAIDKWKDEQHLLHGIKTIRINCFESNMEYIRDNILKSELVNYFDFSSVDWNRVESLSLKNTIKEVCNKWNSGINNTQSLSKMFDVSRTTINTYLKKGNNLGWCVYNPIDEIIKGRNKHIEKIVTPFEMFDSDCNSLGVYISFKSLERESESLFGFKINSGRICEVCKGYKTDYKGYTFKYITKEEYEERKSQQQPQSA